MELFIIRWGLLNTMQLSGKYLEKVLAMQELGISLEIIEQVSKSDISEVEL